LLCLSGTERAKYEKKEKQKIMTWIKNRKTLKTVETSTTA
jgi:hypothetical protein